MGYITLLIRSLQLILRKVRQRSGPSEQAAIASSQSKDNVHIQHDLELHQDTFVATYQECLIHETDSLLYYIMLLWQHSVHKQSLLVQLEVINECHMYMCTSCAC